MKAKRLLGSIRMTLCMGSKKRGALARKHHFFGMVGENVRILPRTLPLYSELIFIHNNVTISRNVDFVTHDGINFTLNKLPKDQRMDYKFKERIGCIEIMDNVMIGSNTTILYDTKIGSNVIIASGSVVTKDCEPNSVYAGVPARKIGTFDDFMKRRYRQETEGVISTTVHNQNLTPEEVETVRANFLRNHGDI